MNKAARSFVFLSLAALTWAGGVRADVSVNSPAAVSLHWLEDDSPATMPGTTWGVPWPRGSMAKGTEFTIHDAAGKALPLQTWPLAYWPDGSLKWTAHALGPDPNLAGPLTLAPGPSALPSQPVTVAESAAEITVGTGTFQCRIAKKGVDVIESMSRDGHVISQDGRLVCLTQDAAELGESGALHSDAFTGHITSVTVEQRGPVRAVIKIEGKHADGKGRAWLPFVLRLYFYAGGDSVRIVHTIIYDGNQNKDFIRGLGLRFTVPMDGALYDRHVRFAGENGGLWAESVQGLTGLRRDPGQAVRDAQIAGLTAPALETWSPKVAQNLKYIPAFGDFTLSQQSADSFAIRKRTKEGFTWLNSAYGHRAAGLGWLGTPGGGVAFGIRNFWQSYPSQLDIRGAAAANATVTLWLWSPETHPMDMRFYHDDMGEDAYAKQLQGLDITYEDYEPGFATAYGVARTSEMDLWAFSAPPSRDETATLANVLQKPPQLVCAPQTYKAADVFGGHIWSVQERSNPVQAQIEDQLDFYIAYYLKQIEEAHWYGFWTYGNVMHSYDKDRHVWRYDVGGFAWDNSELSTDLWLWYDFLRSGRADIYRMAEAMTRQTGEVDVYHLGPFAGLGTRHGVIPWGDSGKQLRISTVANRRFLYYLTGDERIGDLMHEELGSVSRLADVPPDRKVMIPAEKAALRPHSLVINLGTDWGAYSAALLTEWERTGNPDIRQKLVDGMKSLALLPHGFFSEDGIYDPATGLFSPTKDTGPRASHLGAVFGQFEINAELIQLLDVPSFAKAWLQYCTLYNAGAEAQRKFLGADLGKLNLGQAHSRLTAYAAWKLDDSQLAARAWGEFFGAAAGLKMMDKPYPLTILQGADVLNPVDEAPNISTNAVAEWGLAAIECLGLIGDQLSGQVPESPVEK